MCFNRKKCLQLMKEEKKLRQEGKSLWDLDKAKQKELSNYLILLEDDIFWKSNQKYLKILEMFSDGMINGNEFIDQFSSLRMENMKLSKIQKENLENEINLQLNPKSRGFTEIIASLDAAADLFDPDLEDDESSGYGISEGVLKRFVGEVVLPRIKQYCDKY